MNLTRRQFFAMAGALGLASCARVPLPKLGGREDGPWTLATVNDVHLLNARSTTLAVRAVRQINATPGVRLTVVLGDLATDGQLAELRLAKKCLDRLEHPYLTLPGNHDLDGRAPNPYGNYDQCFGARQWTRSEGGWLLIGLDSCQGTESDVTIPADRMEWIQRQLRGLKPDRPIALFAHHPFNPHTRQYRIKNADEVLGLFSGLNLRLVASGHWHGNQVEVHNGVLFTTTACCASTRPNFDDTTEKGYRLFHFDGDQVETEFVAVQG